MIVNGMLVQTVQPGTIITDPESGREFMVNEDQGVAQNGVLFVTPDRYKILKKQLH